jgi:hypothetical protein
MFDSRQMKHEDGDKVVWPSAVPGTSKYDLWRFHHNLWDLGFESCSGGGLVSTDFPTLHGDHSIEEKVASH